MFQHFTPYGLYRYSENIMLFKVELSIIVLKFRLNNITELKMVWVKNQSEKEEEEPV